MKTSIITALFLFIVVSGMSFAHAGSETAKGSRILKGDGAYTITGNTGPSGYFENRLLLAIDRLRDIPNEDGEYERYSYYGDPEEKKEEVTDVPPHMIDVNVGSSAFEVGYGDVYPLNYPMIFTSGVNLLFDFDDYLILRGNVCLGNETIPGITLKVGLEGLLGRSEKDDNMGSLGILVSAAYDQRSKSGIPFEFALQFGLAPSSLCFFDFDEYMEFEATLGIHIFTGERRGTIYVGYRYINLGFAEDDTDDLSDSTPILGFKYRF